MPGPSPDAPMTPRVDPSAMLEVAIAEARRGLAEGGIPIGAALFDAYCSGLVRQFRLGTVIVGESVNCAGGIDWLRENGVEVIDLRSPECIEMLARYIAAKSDVGNEDIGEA